MGDGRRGRLISASDRKQAVELISEAINAGACLYKASAELGISKRTYNRWKNNTNDYIDERITCARPEPVTKLTKEERTTLYSYIDNILEHHFREYGDDITDYFNEHFKPIL